MLAFLVAASLAGAVAAQTLTDLGATAPVPGPHDISQLSFSGNQTSPDSLNYYTDNQTDFGTGEPGQSFTTGNNSAGYYLTSLAVGTAGLGSYAFIEIPQDYYLHLYSISGDTATPLTNFLSGPIAFNDGDWLQWSGLSVLLAPNTTYAYSFGKDGSVYGWEAMGVASGNPCADGEIGLFPVAGGTVSFGGSHDFDATFVAGLNPANEPYVGQPAASPTNNVYAGTQVTLSAMVLGAPPLGIQWLFNDGGGFVNLFAATNNILTINTRTTNSGIYELIVTNSFGSVTSAPVMLTVTLDTNPPVVLQTAYLSATNVQIVFSKPVETASATNLANYAFTNGLLITHASLATNGTVLTLTTAPMVTGSNYTVLINNVRDQALPPNTIAVNTPASFAAWLFLPCDIGDPPVPSTVAALTNGIAVTATGRDIGTASDQFSFENQLRSGDFDVTVRVAGLSLSDLWAKAGLMARETLDGGSRFAAALATPAMNGSFFEWRDPAATTAASIGNFPANYPNTWLRLKRSGNTFTGFAGYDGQTWTQLGSVAIDMPGQIYLGFAVSSRTITQSTTAQFLDESDVTTNNGIAPVANPHEPPGPSSRKTGIVISEIMYKPAPRVDGNNTEFLELYNSNPFFQDIGGYQIVADNMSYTFTAGTLIPGGAYYVVAASPTGMQNVYGLSTNVFGPYTGTLKKSGTIQLLDEQGAVLLTVPYSNVYPWPVAADGTGHSIVLANPTYGEGDPRAWDISDVAGGSPGQMEAFRPNPLCNVVINELLAHTENSNVLDFVELYNHSNQTNDLSGCILTDNPATNKFIFPPGSVVPPRGFVALNQSQLGFDLSASGETIYLLLPDRSRILDAVQFEAQADGVSLGRWPDGANAFYPLAARTPGANNSPILVRNIVINELMYDPISGNDDDQYVELYNQGTNVVNLANWRFTSGITFTFPAVTIAPNGYLVVARNATNLFARYPNLNAANTVGNYGGKLSHNSERIALAMPQSLNGTNTIYVVDDEVTYGTGGRWGQWSSGGGSSLELIDPRASHRIAANWADSDETQKSSWTNIETTGVLDNGADYYYGWIGYAQIGLLDAGECLVDNVEVRTGTDGANLVSNPDFEGGLANWSLQGCFTRSSLENTGYGSSHSLHIRCSDRIWTGDNSCQVALYANSLGWGQTATLRFKARWLHGWPEALLRLNGNWLEATGPLPVPSNLGTPGLPNSSRVTNAGPAIYEVTHTPSLPAANQAAVVTARVEDPNGVQNLTLYYRLDPAADYSSVAMLDDGTGGDAIAGDGVFSTTIPGQAANTIAAFYLSATDSNSVTTRFPALLNDNSPLRECLVMFGDSNPAGSFGTYHLWLTQNNVTRWASLSDLSNESVDGTFVNGPRVIYNMQGRFAGSPYHQVFNTPNGSLCHYKWTFPDDDKLLGATSFNKLHQPGNAPGDDASLQREQMANVLLRSLGVPWLYKRYVAVYVNGNRRGTLMEDTQYPNADLVKEWFPDDTDGYLYKLQPWFEFAPFPYGSYMDFDNMAWFDVMPYTTTGGVKKMARYRYTFEVRRTPDSDNNYTNVYALVDAASSYAAPDYVSKLENVADMENVMRVFAANHAAANRDAYGATTSQNVFGYFGALGTKFSLMMWDFNICFDHGAFSPGQGLFAVNGADFNTLIMYYVPTFRRMYWRALKELVNGPLDVANSGPLLDAKYTAFAANGLTVQSPFYMKNWMSQARASIASQIAAEDTTSFTVNPAIGVSNNIGYVSGTAMMEVKTIWFNGVEYPVTWNSVTGWTAAVQLASGTNRVSVVGVDIHGNPVAGASNTVTTVYNGPVITNSPSFTVSINEWMAGNTHTIQDPLDGNKYDDWFELYNYGTNTVNLAGWFLTNAPTSSFAGPIPAGYTIPPGGFLLVWADKKTPTGSGDLHVGFKLSKSGTSIALYRPDSNLVDSVTFGQQTSDISMGRYPDGSTNVYFMGVPTPRTNNAAPNTAPLLDPISDRVMTLGQILTLAAGAIDFDQPPQILTFSLGTGASAGATVTTNGQFTWKPVTAPVTNRFSVIVADNGLPSLTATQAFAVTVVLPPRVTGVALGQNQFTFGWQTAAGEMYQLEYTTNFISNNWWPLGAPVTGTGGIVSFTNGVTDSLGYFRVRILPP